MEQSFQKDQKIKGAGKVFEYKEYVEEVELKNILSEWLSALEENRDLIVTIKGKECHIPYKAFQIAKTKTEFELKNGEYEFELELKWKESDLGLS